MGTEQYGFQSSQVHKAISLIKEKVSSNDNIVLAFTGNIISSGLRELICLLVKHQKIKAIVTSGAGVEEDIIKTFGDYSNIKFEENTDILLKNKLYRIGNLSVEHDLYNKFDKFLQDNYDSVISNSKCDQTPGEIAKYLAKIRNDKSSFLYWAYENNIDVFCPTFHDGAFGDFFVEYREKFLNYRIDFLLENVKLTRLLLSFEKCGAIILGGGTSKHFTLNNSILRGGYDWSVIISTAIPYDGSDSGGNAEEAKTWGKLQPEGESIHIFSDATLVFPTIVNKSLLS